MPQQPANNTNHIETPTLQATEPNPSNNTIYSSQHTNKRKISIKNFLSTLPLVVWFAFFLGFYYTDNYTDTFKDKGEGETIPYYLLFFLTFFVALVLMVLIGAVVKKYDNKI